MRVPGLPLFRGVASDFPLVDSFSRFSQPLNNVPPAFLDPPPKQSLRKPRRICLLETRGSFNLSFSHSSSTFSSFSAPAWRSREVLVETARRIVFSSPLLCRRGSCLHCAIFAQRIALFQGGIKGTRLFQSSA